MRRMAGTFAFAATLALVTTGCGGDSDTSLDDNTDPVQLGPEADASYPAEPTPTDEAPGTDGRSGSADDADVIDVRSDHPITARPGRWLIHDAGFVEFDVVEGNLTLVDIQSASGWITSTDDESGDSLEIDFTRENIDIEVEIELDDGALEVDINTDHTPADSGEYQLGQAGSMAFDVDGGRLNLTDVTIEDGWEQRTDEESSDEIEFGLRSGHERWQVAMELDDGETELEIDYRVRDTL